MSQQHAAPKQTTVWGKGPSTSVLNSTGASTVSPPPVDALRRPSAGGGSANGSSTNKGNSGPSNNKRGAPKRNKSGRGSSSSLASAATGSSDILQQHHRGGGGGRGGGRGQDKTRKVTIQTAGANRRNSKNDEAGNNNTAASGTKKSLDEIHLWSATGTGRTDAARKVRRWTSTQFLSCRLEYLDPPVAASTDESDDNDIISNSDNQENWTPHARCLWDEPDRVTRIEEEMKVIFDYKPLNVNDETRWKARVMEGGSHDDAVAESIEDRLRKATAILNKLSWTTLDKLTVQFINALIPDSDKTSKATAESDQVTASISKELIRQVMELVVTKAMMEPHFAELYARLSYKLAALQKLFKKQLLAVCQEQFDETGKEVELPVDMEEAEKQLKLTLERKKSIGLMQFIGELYKLKVIKVGIMVGCLVRLLIVDDEEKLECFTKLMSTIGGRLAAEKLDDDNQKDIDEMWDKVYSMAGKKRIENGPNALNNRIKFLLQDLIELQENGWIQRRQNEKAKTIAQIHKEVEEEQQAAARQSKKLSRSQSGGVLRSTSLTQVRPPQDDDGFMQVPEKPKKTGLRRAQSDVVPLSSLQRAVAGATLSPKRPSASQKMVTRPAIHEFFDPSECGNKMKMILKEYFVSGDTADAVLSIGELVETGHDGHIERGAAMVEAGVLLVMEMMETDVNKFLTVILECLAQGKIDPLCVAKGLNDPLEFLRDIEIDAPHASTHLAHIVSEAMNAGILSIEFFKDTPDTFKSSGNPVPFIAQVLSKRGGEITQNDVIVVEGIMNEEERQEHASVRDWIQSLM